ncbi:MAG: hypothetical protein ACT4QG_15595 [Sporichthyaceae bacterium]
MPTNTVARLGLSSIAVVVLAAGCGGADEVRSAAAPSPSVAAPAEHDDHAEHATDKLGTVSFPVSCTPEAQAEFNRGTAQLHSFWFAPATASFKRVVELDGTCAMGHWGQAMSSLGNPFAWPLAGQPLVDGRAAADRAVAVGTATPREKAYVDAVGVFYRDADTVDHVTRATAYAQAMGQLVEANPEDTEAKIFYALALDATAKPTDKTYANQKQAAALLEPIFVAQPDHPGVAHYLIHTYDYPTGANAALTAAQRYSSIAPAAPHALHMPSHIFTRLGDWDASIRSNDASAKAARNELTADHPQGAGSYNALHALDYLMYAYLQTGRDQAAQGVLAEINAISKLDLETFAGAYAFAAIPARLAFERGEWQQAANLTLHPANLDWKRFPQAEAVNAFARGLGAARNGDAAAAAVELARLDALKTALVAAKQAYWAGQVDIQKAEIEAWVALVKGDGTEALKLMRAATDLEAATEKHPVMPGPLVPARELLGEMLLVLEQPAAALAEFEATAQVEPNRFRSLYGAGRAAELAGDATKARSAYEQLVQLAANGDGQRPDLATAKAYLAKAPSN